MLRLAAAAVYAFTLRHLRMKAAMASWGLSDAFWMLIFMLAALAFTSKGEWPLLVPVIYWSIVAWSLMSEPTWNIGEWARTYIVLGLFDENELAGMSHRLFLAARIIPSLAVSVMAASAALAILYSATGVNPLRAINPLLLAASLAAILAISTLYSLTLAWIGLTLRIPVPLLDVMNIFFFVVGGVAVDLSSMPEPMRIVALATPYSHPAELMRYAVSGDPPYLGLTGEAAATVAFIVLLAALESLAYRVALVRARRWGIKGLGFT